MVEQPLGRPSCEEQQGGPLLDCFRTAAEQFKRMTWAGAKGMAEAERGFRTEEGRPLRVSKEKLQVLVSPLPNAPPGPSFPPLLPISLYLGVFPFFFIQVEFKM